MQCVIRQGLVYRRRKKWEKPTLFREFVVKTIWKVDRWQAHCCRRSGQGSAPACSCRAPAAQSRGSRRCRRHRRTRLPARLCPCPAESCWLRTGNYPWCPDGRRHRCRGGERDTSNEAWVRTKAGAANAIKTWKVVLLPVLVCVARVSNQVVVNVGLKQGQRVGQVRHNNLKLVF